MVVGLIASKVRRNMCSTPGSAISFARLRSRIISHVTIATTQRSSNDSCSGNPDGNMTNLLLYTGTKIDEIIMQ